MQLIADRLNVSKYAVSQALSGKIGVSEATRQDVEAMARSLGYQYKPAKKASIVEAALVSSQAEVRQANQAENLDMNKAKPCVAIWIDESQRYEPSFWSRVLDGAMRGCMDNGWKTEIHPYSRHLQKADLTNEAVKRISSYIGAIVIGTLPVSLLNKLVLQQATHIPVILVDHEEPLIRADCILNANLEAAQAACRHLLSQSCKRILFVGKDHYSASFKDRWWGCRQAMDESARQAEGYTLKKWTISYNQPNWEMQLAKRIGLLQQGELPDGFICANDAIALTLLKLLQQQQIVVPDQCKVIGIDNIDAGASSEPPLTTVELAKELLGNRAVEALARRLSHPSAYPEKIILSERLIVRNSG
ncbi:LacI family DNA-binding transcriptional regulator [Paenibacillus agricola]|uniref:LacI family transcriptional regulator n=1 Tax=Paenibacillus agricola TaxID=2716264 RepID=A0ABX0J243_9BACL|nr:LacI family DNA-binding transcriptional regulator [Paenibacillus agricola]NHN29194.1 LacI family transcriptional regulator [Paenibacillus agricola]